AGVRGSHRFRFGSRASPPLSRPLGMHRRKRPLWPRHGCSRPVRPSALFNQPNEAAADVEGTINVLDAGRARGGRGSYSWTEGGGLLSMRFFAGFGQLSPASILLGFERSHPPPQLRTPLIQQAAANWRSTGGNPWRLPGF